jgi:hypothetical protein
MINLLQETIDYLKENGKSVSDVQWVGSEDVFFSWEEFAKVADISYNDSYGIVEIVFDLVVVGSDFWLERSIYDGSEEWAFKTLPKKPETHIIPETVTSVVSYETLKDMNGV